MDAYDTIKLMGTIFPGIYSRVDVPCTCEKWTVLGPDRRQPVLLLVTHLNDACGWSREQIADWLENLDVDLTMTTESLGD